MRQLMISGFLFLFVIIGVYWLVTQRLHLNSFYPSPTVMFPNLGQPRPLPSITPGPAPAKLAGFAQAPSAKAPTVNVTTTRFSTHPVRVPISYKQIPVTAPTALAVTPMPAPAYAPVTPMPFAVTPAPIVAPTFAPIGGAPSPSPSPARPGAPPS
ncbi:MAG: hypothetical protein ACHQY2_02540 [Candidatus Eremiobacterales bacterium]